MSEAYQCDRCKSFYAGVNSGPVNITHPTSRIIYQEAGHLCTVETYIDLCPQCIREFRKIFMKEDIK